jgi:hypothetical protein
MTNQPAEGTFSRLMATTALMRRTRESSSSACRDGYLSCFRNATAAKRKEPTDLWQKTYKSTIIKKQQHLATE